MKRMLLVALAAGCGGSKWYDTEVEMVRATTVQVGPDGAPLDVDVHLEYPGCPGHQVEVIRGNAEFAKCIQKYPDGSRLPAHIEHYRTIRNTHDWDVHKLGDCERTPDPDDESSFDTVEECEPTVVNGVEEGFLCNHVPHAALLRECPWFARH